MITAKPQPSLRGIAAWVLKKLVQKRGVTQAEVAAWIVERWVEDNWEGLLDKYDITIRDFESLNSNEGSEDNDS